MTILITGATGTVSTPLVRSLHAAGADLRVLVRHPAKAPDLPDVAVVVGDLEDPASLTPAIDGVDVMWLLTVMGPQAPHAAMNAVWAARAAGVGHIVRMSAIGAAHDAPTRNGRLHALSEVELKASGIPWTIIRPHFFMQNLFGSVIGDTLFGSTGGGRLGMIDVRDIADFAVGVLSDPAPHADKTYTLTGPTAISLRQAANDLHRVLGTPIAYQPLSAEQARDAMIEAGLDQWTAAVSAEYGVAYAGGWGDFTTPDFGEVMQRPARTFAEFAGDHTDQLRTR